MVPGPTLDTGHSQGAKHSPQFHGAYLLVSCRAVNPGKAGEEDKMGAWVVGGSLRPWGAGDKNLIWVY